MGRDEDALLSLGMLSPSPRTALWESENATSSPGWPVPRGQGWVSASLGPSPGYPCSVNSLPSYIWKPIL